MSLKKEKINSVLFYLYFFLLLFSIFIPTISSILLNILISFTVFLLLFFNNYKDLKLHSKNFIFLFFISLLLLLSIIFSKGGLGSLINSLNFLMGILIFTTLIPNKQQIRFIYIICTLIYVYNFWLSFDVWNQYLNMTFKVNPNSVGIFLFINFVVLHSWLKDNKKKTLSIILIIITLYGINMTNCRSALVAMLIYVILCYIPIISKLIFKYRKSILYVLTIFGALVPLVVVCMYINNVNFKIPFMEKRLYTGREKLWYSILEAFKTTKSGYLFGLGTNYATSIGLINNCHNWFMGVYYNFGIIVFILYFKYLINNIVVLNRKEIVYALIAVFTIGFFENIGLWAETQIYIYIFMIMGRYIKEEKIT